MAAKKPITRAVAKGKRVIFITTLYLQMIRNFNPSKDCLERLNNLFKLVTDTNALKFPALLRQRVWKGRDQAIQVADAQLSEGAISEACDTVLANTPKWLRYEGADVPEQQTDVREVAAVVAQEKQQQHAASA